MDNNFENTPENTNGETESRQENNSQPEVKQPGAEAQQGAEYTYTDPNAGYTTNTEYAQNSTNQQNYGYQDNYNYNVGNNTGYNPKYDTGMDQSPMSMGDWLLTILIMTFIPCVGIILYFVWAFGKNGNINRRNYCRAYLIIMGIGIVLAVIFFIVFGIASINTLRYY